MARKIVANQDNEGLFPIVGDRVVIGWVDEVNGEGAEELAAFVPTRHELRQLYKFWARQATEIDVDCFLYKQTGSTELRLRPYADRRVGRITDLLGPEECNLLWQDVESDLARQYGDLWTAFKEGDSTTIERYSQIVAAPITMPEDGDPMLAAEVAQPGEEK